MEEPGRWLRRARYGLYRRVGLNRRKRRAIRRGVGQVTESAVRRFRVLTGREQHLAIDRCDLVLPPEHRLPYFRRRDVFYDVHARTLLAALAAAGEPVVLIDVGANVGDTAVAALTAAPNIRVVAVEGNPAFAGYARRNLTPFGDRSVLVEAFVGPIRGLNATYRSTGGGSGNFSGAEDTAERFPVRWVTPAALLTEAEADVGEVVVWKSDVDGLDIHVLVEHWDAIADACEVIWFEYDPLSTIGDPGDVAALVDRVAGAGRGMIVFDNLGNRMLSVAPHGDVAETLRDLTGWLYAQHAGHVMVRYFDIWLVTASRWAALSPVGRFPNPAERPVGVSPDQLDPDGAGGSTTAAESRAAAR